MKRLKTRIPAAGLLLLTAATAVAQAPETVGRASYAPYPPAYKGRTPEHEGFNATAMMTRRVYADETDASGNPRPLPTNDWWTDLLNNPFSGAMWSYPAMIRTGADGVEVNYPTYWNENGTEVKPTSRVLVGGADFSAEEAVAADWHDWDVEVRMRDTATGGRLLATLVHGNPFTIVEYTGLTPELTFSAAPALTERAPGGMALTVGTDAYGVWYAEGAEVTLTGNALRVEGSEWVSVGLLPDAADFAAYSPYAASAVRDTKVSWSYDENTSLLSTEWRVTARNLRDAGATAPVMQGFLPHAYKHATTADWTFDGEYLTPRGRMRMARSDSGRFSYAYRFAGVLPTYALPDAEADPRYDPEVMRGLMKAYAEGGGFGDDTYWGGKGLTQMALNMTFARAAGETAIYETAKSRLRDALVDWLTYTPGEKTKFFSYYPRWGGMLGFDVSYDSDAFNDHHFHYGYFIYAAALLCMEDESFRDGYGELLRMIAKDYANYDRSDTRFPFLRTLDPWAGHSYAGGLGDAGNDNGNGQESSSEAMQGWGGVFLLGVALGDDEMRDAGIFGWLTESRATAEYWFDRDHIRPGAAGNYDYTLYGHPYNTNITSKGIGWWTWFSGDPLWMHSIQWLPVSPCLSYLSEDLDFARWDYTQMMDRTAYRWFEESEEGGPLAEQSVGNVVLCYLERFDPEGAADIFDEALERESGIARGIDTGHISYYVIHNHLTYGEQDFGVTADCPTAAMFRRQDGTETFVVYNPGSADRKVTFRRDGVAVRTVTAPGGRMTAFGAEAVPAGMVIECAEGRILPPGASGELTTTLYDQYGARIEGTPGAVLAVEGPASLDGNRLLVDRDAPKGSRITVTARDIVEGTLEIEVNDMPRTVTASVTGVGDMVETGSVAALALETVDQYGSKSTPSATWSVVAPDGSVSGAPDGIVTFARAGVYSITARHGDDEAALRVVALPPFGNVAGGCGVTVSSEENAGTLGANAVDGDHESRWGSAHTDSEWLVLDLGREHRIASVTIDWEAAYAADYDVEVAPEGDAGAWSTIHSQRSLPGPGIVRHIVDATGRYVRVNCLRRGSQYGYSIKEIEVGGFPTDSPSDMAVGLDIELPQVMTEGETAGVSARVVRLDGSLTDAGGIEWSSDREARFAGDDFTPLTYGVHTVTATSGGLSTAASVLVEESLKLHGVTVTPAVQTVLTGDAAYIRAEGVNQFGGLHPVDTSGIEVAITEAVMGAMDPAKACYDIETGRFTATDRGDYTLDFGGMATATVHVRDITEANLASGKPARASTSLGGNTPDKAFDEDMDTRWESEFADGQWLQVDLRGLYVIDRVVLFWEAAYASEYNIETSADGVEWVVAHSTDSGRGGDEEIELPDIRARYVRVNCRRRSTGYGNSLHEMQVYGKERIGDPVEVDEIGVDDADGADVYTADGLLIMRGADREAMRRLAPGVYIVRGKGVIIINY